MPFLKQSALALGFFLSFCGAAQAATINITFDEPGITANTVITNQYSGLGLTFSGTLARVKTAASFSISFPSDGQVLHFDFKPVAALVDLATAANTLSFDFRRPSESGAIGVAIFDGATLVHDFGSIPWPGPDWLTFNYDGSFGTFNRVSFTGAEKYVIDNLSVTTVPIPASVLLMISALPLLPRQRRQDV